LSGYRMDNRDKNVNHLLADGWKKWSDTSHRWSYYKRFDTPTRCKCNDDKAGIQVCVAMYERGYEISLFGELPDETWIELKQWVMPKDIKKGLAKIPRLLATWEFIANEKERDIT